MKDQQGIEQIKYVWYTSREILYRLEKEGCVDSHNNMVEIVGHCTMPAKPSTGGQTRMNSRGDGGMLKEQMWIKTDNISVRL